MLFSQKVKVKLEAIKDQLLVSVEKADGTKCARCWKIVSSANKNKCSRTKICPLQNAGK